jgi:hypothetical protein
MEPRPLSYSISVVLIQSILQLNPVVTEGITRWESRPVAEDEDIGAMFVHVRRKSRLIDIVIRRTSVLLPLLHGNDIGIAQDFSIASTVLQLSPPSYR